MNRSFRAILYKAHPMMSGGAVVQCVVGYVKHCVKRGSLVINETTDRKVFSARQVEKREKRFLKFVGQRMKKWDTQMKVIKDSHDVSALRQGFQQQLRVSSPQYSATPGNPQFPLPSRARQTCCVPERLSPSGQ